MGTDQVGGGARAALQAPVRRLLPVGRATGGAARRRIDAIDRELRGALGLRAAARHGAHAGDGR